MRNCANIAQSKGYEIINYFYLIVLQVTRSVGREKSVGLDGGRLVLSGDSFTTSTVDGCFSAAAHAASTLRIKP